MKTKILATILCLTVFPQLSFADEYITEETYDAQDGSSTVVYSDSTGLHRRERYNGYGRPVEPRLYDEGRERQPTQRDIERIKELQAIEHYNRQARMQEERQQAENDYQERRNNISSVTEASFAARNAAQAIKQISDMMKGGSGGMWYAW